MHKAILNAAPATSTRLAHARAAPRLQAQLHSGLQLPSSQVSKPRVSDAAILLANNFIRHADASNRLADKRDAKEQAAAAIKAAELAQQAATRQLASRDDSPLPSSSSSCQAQAWQRPARDPDAPHPAHFLMEATASSRQSQPQHSQHSMRSSQSQAPQQQQMSLREKVAGKFAAYVPPSVQRRAAATPAPSLAEKLAQKYAEFLAKPLRQAATAA